MVDYEILLGDAQSSGGVGWGFANHNKVFGIIDHVLTLARCAEIPSADLWNASNFQDIYIYIVLKKIHGKTRHDKTISLSLTL